jgi:Uma2 family endonuclease
MSITLDIPTRSEAEPRIPLAGVTWEQYETMIRAVGDRPRLRMSYLDGTLEIMTISPEHEMHSPRVPRLPPNLP